MEKLRIVVGGFIGLFPTGGATWDYIQYPLGLMLMGHDVYYIEDTMQYPAYQLEGKAWDDATDNISYLKEIMESFGMSNRWAYRDVATNQSFGLTESQIGEICRTADVFINVSCATFLKDEYLRIPKRILIDSDPMFTQIQYHNEVAGLSSSSTKFMVENHNYLFTFGENIGSENCQIPTLATHWHTTRQPICINLWRGANGHNKHRFTSIMNWSGRKKLLYGGEKWGQKDVEFERFIEVPKKCIQTKFEVVITPPLNFESHFDSAQISSFGWNVLNPHQTIEGPAKYKKFILESYAEFAVAKETYVKSNSGWFSCRSACYLAAGKPVATQDTTWSKYIPAGIGLLAFTDMESAIHAIETINSDYKNQAKAAEEIASSYFDSAIVLQRMLDQLN